MKVYIVSYTVSNDEGNFTNIEGVYDNKSKAISEIKALHDNILSQFNNQEDEYEDEHEYEDGYFDIYASRVTHSAYIEEAEVE